MPMYDVATALEYDVVSVRNAADLRLAEYTYHADAVTPLHSHNSDHLYVVVAGSCAETDRRETFEAHAGTVVYHPAGDTHSVVTSPEGARIFGVEMAWVWRERIRTDRRTIENPYHAHVGVPSSIALKLYREFREPDDLSSLAIEALMLELLVDIVRSDRYSQEPGPPRWLCRVRDMLDEQFAEAVSLDEIARLANVHPSYLARTFRQHYHCTVGEYIRQRRIQSACRLLATSQQSLGDISLDVGYSDQSHFSRAFKRITGLTPAEYRASARSG